MIRSAHVDTFARDNLPPQRAVAGIPLHAAGAAISGPAQLRHRIARPLGRQRRGRPHLRHLADRDADLCAARRAHEPHRQCADARSRPRARQPRAAARANNPMMIAAYLAVMKAGGVMVATMPLLRAKELSYTSTRRRSRSRSATTRLADEMEKTKALAPDLQRIVYWGDGPDALESLMAQAGLRDFHRLRHRHRRCLPDRLHLRHHRRAERHHAFPPRHAGALRLLRPPCAAGPPDDRFIGSAAARLHLRARRACAVPVPRRRRHDPARKGAARGLAAGDREIQGDRRASPRRPPIAPCSAQLAEHDISSLRKCVSAGETLAEADLRRLAQGDRHRRSSTASARPR